MSRSDPTPRLLPPHGGYRELRSFQAAELVYDGTVIFCERFVDKRSRTRDQMVQAARSGRQNIAEGSVASATSKKSELKLTNVAKASLEELLLDYEDFLRQRRLPRWDKNAPPALEVRRRHSALRPGGSDPYDLGKAAPEIAANTLICLIHQAIYLLGRQLQRLEREFVEQGGFTERLYRTRSDFRKSDRSDRSDRSDKSDKSDKSDPSDSGPCPRCGKPMVLRTARRGSRAGEAFWGCSGFPGCTGTRPAG